MSFSIAKRTAAGEPGIVSTITWPITPPMARLSIAAGSDVLVAQHTEDLAVAGQRFGEHLADRFEGLVAGGDARAAGDEDGIRNRQVR